MSDLKGATGYSRAIDEILSPNSLKVLQKRYLNKDEAGNPTENPSDMFVRVAENIAAAERVWGADDAAVAEVAQDFYDLMTSLEFLPNSPDAHERRSRAAAAVGLLRAAGRGLHGVDLRRRPGHGPHPQVRRRHRLQLLASASRRRPGSLDAGRLERPGVVHARVQPGDRSGQAGRHAPRREHGRLAHRPPGHPQLHQVQGRRRLRELQHLGRADREVHGGRQGRYGLRPHQSADEGRRRAARRP